MKPLYSFKHPLQINTKKLFSLSTFDRRPFKYPGLHPRYFAYLSFNPSSLFLAFLCQVSFLGSALERFFYVGECLKENHSLHLRLPVSSCRTRFQPL